MISDTIHTLLYSDSPAEVIGIVLFIASVIIAAIVVCYAVICLFDWMFRR